MCADVMAAAPCIKQSKTRRCVYLLDGLGLAVVLWLVQGSCDLCVNVVRRTVEEGGGGGGGGGGGEVIKCRGSSVYGSGLLAPQQSFWRPWICMCSFPVFHGGEFGA
jgi:hypothetical protein